MLLKTGSEKVATEGVNACEFARNQVRKHI